MSKLISIGNQQRHDFLYDASGSIGTGGTAQIVLPQQLNRSFLLFQNLSAHTMYLEFGCGWAHASLTNGVVTSVTVDNAGFNFTRAPLIRFLGGGQPVATTASGQPFGVNSSYVSAGGDGFPAPSNPASAHATLASSAIALNKINTIVVDNGGSGYNVAPYVQILASDLDPNGCGIPASTNATSIALPTASAPLILSAGMCPTDAISVVSSGTSDLYCCKYMV